MCWIKKSPKTDVLDLSSPSFYGFLQSINGDGYPRVPSNEAVVEFMKVIKTIEDLGSNTDVNANSTLYKNVS